MPGTLRDFTRRGLGPKKHEKPLKASAGIETGKHKATNDALPMPDLTSEAFCLALVSVQALDMPRPILHLQVKEGFPQANGSMTIDSHRLIGSDPLLSAWAAVGGTALNGNINLERRNNFMRRNLKHKPTCLCRSSCSSCLEASNSATLLSRHSAAWSHGKAGQNFQNL